MGVHGGPRRARARQRLRLARLPAGAGRHPRAAKAFDRLLSEAGLGLDELYRHGREHEQLYQLAELLTEWDERIWLWRFRHYAIVARALGEDTIGTQGTPVQVLGKLIAQRQIPKLWDVRSRLVELFDAEHKGSAE